MLDNGNGDSGDGPDGGLDDTDVLFRWCVDDVGAIIGAFDLHQPSITFNFHPPESMPPTSNGPVCMFDSE